MTHFAAETFRMPRCIHSFDNSSNDEFSTFATARCIQDVETMFAIFSGFKFVEQTIGEWTETLGTTELKESKLFKNSLLNFVQDLPETFWMP